MKRKQLKKVFYVGKYEKNIFGWENMDTDSLVTNSDIQLFRGIWIRIRKIRQITICIRIQKLMQI